MIRDRSIGPFARALAFLMFRRVEVQGRGNIPAEGSIMIIANHENNLVDPMLLFAFTGLRPRFLAKHTLFTHALVRPLVRLAHAVPVYRREDGGDARRNDTTLTVCARSLAAGDTIGIFPEGGCHNEPSRRPLKAGAARIAVEAARMDPAHPVYVLPIGLYYTAKSRFRSSAAVLIGEPLLVRADDAPRDLKSAMAGALFEVTLNAASWDTSLRALDDAQMAAGRLATAPGPLERFRRHRAALSARDESLLVSTLTDAMPGASDCGARVRAWDELPESPNGLSRVLLLSVPALAGLLLAGLPLALTLSLSGDEGRTPDVPATRRLIGALLFSPPLVAMLVILIGWMAGGFAAVVALIAAPFAGYCTLLFSDAWSDARREIKRGPRPASRGLTGL